MANATDTAQPIPVVPAVQPQGADGAVPVRPAARPAGTANLTGTQQWAIFADSTLGAGTADRPEQTPPSEAQAVSAKRSTPNSIEQDAPFVQFVN